MIGFAWLHLASFVVILVAICAVRRWMWRHALAGAAIALVLTLAGLYLYNRLGFALR